ncbi:MAG: hypothetical protein HY034_09565 [Nitrospirae bacterium]|nr:hypothetical protein [Nitrospirota bacterium]
MRSLVNKISLSALFFITAITITLIISAGSAEAAKREALLQGQILTEKCLSAGRLSACYIEWTSKSPVVLFTGDRKLYRIELHRLAQWKLDNAFGKQVVLKGIIKGNKIMANDIAVLGGKKKLSKACL